MWACLLLSRKRESRPPSRASVHRPRPSLAPSGPGRTGARGQPAPHRGDRATMPSSPRAEGGWRARAGSRWQSGRSAPTRSLLHPSAPRARRPGTAPPSRLRAYVRRDTAGGGPGTFPSALAEPVSPEAAPTGTEKAGRPEPSSRELERPGHQAGLATAASREGRGRRGRRLEPEAEEALRAGSGA